MSDSSHKQGDVSYQEWLDTLSQALQDDGERVFRDVLEAYRDKSPHVTIMLVKQLSLYKTSERFRTRIDSKRTGTLKYAVRCVLNPLAARYGTPMISSETGHIKDVYVERINSLCAAMDRCGSPAQPTAEYKLNKTQLRRVVISPATDDEIVGNEAARQSSRPVGKKRRRWPDNAGNARR